MAEAPDDTTLMVAFRDGDEEAFVTLYRRYRDPMVNFTRRMLGDVARGEEAAQDVFLKLYRAAPRYQPSARFSTFLYRIATNHCLNIRARHDNRLTDRGVDAGERATSPAEQTEAVRRAELRGALREGLAGLPEKQQAALVLCHYQELSYQEAADSLGCSVPALKSLLHRARSSLSRQLDPLLVNDEV